MKNNKSREYFRWNSITEKCSVLVVNRYSPKLA
jgi:hypothetical protein